MFPEKSKPQKFISNSSDMDTELLENEFVCLRYLDLENTDLHDRMNALERINSDLSLQVHELTQKLSDMKSHELFPENLGANNESCRDAIEQYRQSILELVAERDHLLLHISLMNSNPGHATGSGTMKRMKSSPNFVSHANVDGFNLENKPFYQLPDTLKPDMHDIKEKRIMSDNDYSSSDCNNILSQFDANRNISFTDIKRPLIFESHNSWTYVDKRITVCFLPKKKL